MHNKMSFYRRADTIFGAPKTFSEEEQLELAELAARAASAIRQADGLLITGGAVMGVDSGLPDFRGNEGFWRARSAKDIQRAVGN